MALLEVLGLRRGLEKPEYYHDVRVGLMLMIAVLFSISGLGRHQPSVFWLTIGSFGLVISIACVYYSKNRKAVLAGLFGFIALRGLIGFAFSQSYSALILAIVSLAVALLLWRWNQNSTNLV
jgi:hypothetical protein